MDKMREEFEAWAKLEGLPTTYLASCGFYDAKATELCWQAWQASRKALVVELPTAFPLSDDKDSAEVAYVLDILEKLALAGVTYK